MLFIVSILGYLFSVLKEKIDLYNNRVTISSKKVSQNFLDEIDLKAFKLGNIKLTIGDRIKIYLKDKDPVKGVVLGAKKYDNSLVILTLEDKILELNVTSIKKLKIISRYGKLF
jgi:hypothetical protein